MARFRKKPIVIDAFQLTKETRLSNVDWPDWMHQAWQLPRANIGALCPYIEGNGDGPLGVYTLEGFMRCDFGDWILKGVKGELYPCKPDIFQATYEPVKD